MKGSTAAEQGAAEGKHRPRDAAMGLPEAYLAAILSGDRRRAFAVVDDAVRAGVDLRTLYLEVFQPALRETGRLWSENRITVADEHLATAITEAAMARLYDRLFASAPPGKRMLIAACADDERHAVGLRMVCDLLELDGWDTVFLGAAVPLDDLVGMVKRRRPDAVALSASTLAAVPRIVAAIRGLRDALGAETPVIAVGGRPFNDRPELASEVGADITASDAMDATLALAARLP